MIKIRSSKDQERNSSSQIPVGMHPKTNTLVMSDSIYYVKIYPYTTLVHEYCLFIVLF